MPLLKTICSEIAVFIQGRFHPKYKISPEWDLISKVALSKRTLKDLLNGKKLNGGEEREGPTGEEELIDSFFGELEIDTSGNYGLQLSFMIVRQYILCKVIS